MQQEVLHSRKVFVPPSIVSFSNGDSFKRFQIATVPKKKKVMYCNMTITEDLSNPTAVTPNNKPRTAFAQSM